MQIYLPIAELSVNIFLILALGGATGILSGMFGVGGGFLMTPFLMFIGVSPPVAVATAANQIVAASVSGFLAHLRRANVDFRMGTVLLIGGLIGSTLGINLFIYLSALGQIDAIISVFYVTFLGTVGGLMAAESFRALFNIKLKPKPESRFHILARSLPMQMFFPRSNIQLSALLPLSIGFLVGILVSMMGVGGGFFLIPAMIYILKMPTSVVIGTSLFQIIFITANVTLLQAYTLQTVDIVLALLLLSGSVFGAQIGSKIGAKLPPVKLRALLALLVLGVATKLTWDLFAPPDNPWTVISQ